VEYIWRPGQGPVRAITSGVAGQHVRSINGGDLSQEIEFKAFEIENQTADAVVLSQYFTEEEFTEAFEISEGVVIPPGKYSFDYTCVSVSTGEHRLITTQTAVCDGEYYDGRVSSFETKTTWRPSMHFRVTIGGEYNDIDLPQGDFITRLWTLNADVAFNVAWSWENFLQYDNVSDTIGVNSILRWIPRAGRETVLAINSQFEDFDRDRNFQSYTSDLTLKLSYTFRF